MRRNIILALGVIAMFGLFAITSVEATMLKTGQSTKCAGDFSLINKSPGAVTTVEVAYAQEVRRYNLQTGFGHAVKFDFPKEERLVASGSGLGVAEATITNITPGATKVKVKCGK